MHDKKRREISKHLHQRDGKLTQWSAEKHPLPTDPSVFLPEANTLDISSSSLADSSTGKRKVLGFTNDLSYRVCLCGCKFQSEFVKHF